MEFNSQNPRYTNRFMSHLMSFISEYKLIDKDEKLLLAVSGGIDSIVLLFAIYRLQRFGYSNILRVVHINHQSRPGQDEEERFVHKFCEQLGVECQSVSLTELADKSNFEYKARLKRYEAFYQIAKPDEKIVLAHHIDDSFEWSLLQSLRSSSIEGLVGIPLVNGNIVRPFMCVTKEQIKKFADFFDLPFIEDPTNELIKYERNFIRAQVVPAFSDRYQKYLKHYVYRHNEISRRLGLHYIYKNKSSFHITYGSNSALIYSFDLVQDLAGIEELIIKGMKHLNPNSRGSLSGQIEKIKQASLNGKFGPLVLTKGIQAYLDFNLILLTKKTEVPMNLIFREFVTFSFDEYFNYITHWIPDRKTQLEFPFWVLVKGGSLDTRNFSTSFSLNALKELQDDENPYYPALKLLREWSKKKNRHKVLRLNFLRQQKLRPTS